MATYVDPLREMAVLAWNGRLRAPRQTWRSVVRRSNLLKPFELIIDQIERHPDMNPDRLRAAAAEEIFDYLERVTLEQYWSPRRRLETIRAYVDLFFDELLAVEHRGDINRLLGRKRVLRSAYLMYVRQAIPEKVAETADTAPDAVADDTGLDEAGEES